jgi:enoyl-CoA hydratase
LINVTKRGSLGIIEIDRPQRRNALDVEHCYGLREAMEMVQADHARVVVLTGAGSSFCAGADLDGVYDVALREALYPALHAVAEAPVPVVAAVNGPAIGAGTQLAIACDLRVATQGAVFSIPSAKIGLAVDPWTVRRLAELVGHGTASAMLIGCEELPARLAYERGLIDRIADREAGFAWAAEIAELAPLTLAYSKRALNHPDDPELPALFEACWASADLVESQRARQENRAAQFHGR